MKRHKPKRKLQPRRLLTRRLLGSFESLESRLMLIAEGSSYDFSGNYDVFGLSGNVSAEIRWGDGTSSQATVSTTPRASQLKIRFDYSLDATNFFSSQERRNLLQAAADAITSKLSDNLLSLSGSAGNTWRVTFQNPATGQSITRENLSINTNEILVYAGARQLTGGNLAFASRGGTGGTFSDQAFADRVRSRGQSGALREPATDFGPWGGSIAFDQGTRWHFGTSTTGLDSNEFDFMTVAQHEIMHILGFGTAPSFDRFLVGNSFTGPNTQRVSGLTPVPMSNSDHFSSVLLVDGKSALMDSGAPAGARELPSRLDFAALQDLGWTLVDQRISVSGAHTYGDNGNLNGVVVLKGANYGEISHSFSVNVTNVAPTLTKPNNVTVMEKTPLSLPSLGVFTDPGFGASNAQPPTQETFTYSINWGDNSAVDQGTATISQLGNSTRPTRGSFGGTHTYSTPGTYRAFITLTDDDGGSSRQEFVVTVTALPSLRLESNTPSFFENAGNNAAVLTIRRVGYDLSRATVLTFESDQTAKIALPATATIPIGAESVTVPVQAIDNALLDGDIPLRIVAVSGTTKSNQISMLVKDYEELTATTSLAIFSENAGKGASTITIRRPNSDNSASLTVQLRSSDESELQVPSSVVIPAGQSSITVGINAIDDNLFDGQQVAQVTMEAKGYVSATLSFAINDYQPLQLALRPLIVLHEENTDQKGTNLVVSLRSPAPTGGLAVTLESTPPRQISHPEVVVIPAGQTSAMLRIEAIDDYAPQGDRTIQLAVRGVGVEAALIDIALTDDDESIWTNMDDVFDVDGDGSLSPLDVLEVVNSINLVGTRLLTPETDSDELFIDPNMDGWVSPLDALYVINELNRRLRDR